MKDELRQELDKLAAEQIGLIDHVPAGPTPTGERKLVVFTPDDGLETVRAALFAAGAGRIGAYERCSFYSPGTGTFLGGEESSPTIGEAGREERVTEVRLEVVYPADREPALIDALVAAHPYETPAFDLYPLANVSTSRKCGRLGRYDGDVAERLRELPVGPVFVRREPRPGSVAVFTGLPGPCVADTLIAPAGDPDILVPELERRALRFLG